MNAERSAKVEREETNMMDLMIENENEQESMNVASLATQSNHPMT
jgi:hypothetical protein